MKQTSGCALTSQTFHMSNSSFNYQRNFAISVVEIATQWIYSHLMDQTQTDGNKYVDERSFA